MAKKLAAVANLPELAYGSNSAQVLTLTSSVFLDAIFVKPH